MAAPGWKRVVNVRFPQCSVYIGSPRGQNAWEAMLTAPPGKPQRRLDDGQQALLKSLGWQRPESKMVIAFDRAWTGVEGRQVASDLIQTVQGVYGWSDDEPPWVHLEFKRNTRKALVLKPIIDAMDTYTAVFLKPNVLPRQHQAWSACRQMLRDRRCDLIVHVKEGRLGRLRRVREDSERLTAPIGKLAVHYLLHPEAADPLWVRGRGLF
jgi:hypothetical protein